jgi:hypothetical protein
VGREKHEWEGNRRSGKEGGREGVARLLCPVIITQYLGKMGGSGYVKN